MFKCHHYDRSWFQTLPAEDSNLPQWFLVICSITYWDFQYCYKSGTVTFPLFSNGVLITDNERSRSRIPCQWLLSVAIFPTLLAWDLPKKVRLRQMLSCRSCVLGTDFYKHNSVGTETVTKGKKAKSKCIMKWVLAVRKWDRIPLRAL